MPVILIVLYSLAGFTLSFGLVHLLSAWGDRKRPRGQKEDTGFWFGLISLGFSLYSFLQAAILQSDSAALSSGLLRAQGAVLSGLFILMPLFGSAFGKRRLDWGDWLPMSAYGLIALWSLLSPAGYWFTRVEELIPSVHGKGIILNTPRGPASATYYASILIQYPLFFRQILDARRGFKAGDRTTGLIWGIGVFAILLTGTYDKLVDFNIFQPPYVGEYPFPLLMLAMGIRLSSRREEALLALQRSREEAAFANARFRDAFDNSGDALFIHDADTGEILETNRTMREMYGYPLDGKPPFSLEELSAQDPAYSREKAEEHIEEARRAGRTRFSWMARRREGTTFPVEVTLKRVSLQGRAAILASVRETTDREQALSALRREMAFNAAILDGLPGIFYLVDASRRLVSWNSRLEGATGLGPEELRGRELPSIFPEEESQRAAAALLAAPYPGERQAVTMELPLSSKDGGATPYLFTAIRMETLEGSMVLGVGLDLSDRVRAETKEKESAERLRMAQRLEAVGQLAAGVAHDFNNLLSPIMGYASLLVETSPGPEQLKEGLSQILSAAEKAQALTRQLLAISRARAAELRAIDVNAHIGEMAPLLRSLLKGNRLFAFHPCREEAWIMADRSHLEQAVVNLAANARDAMPDGGTFTLSSSVYMADEGFLARHPECSLGGYLLLEARDTGTGMDEGTMARIFEPFFTTKEEGKGTGLGLATVLSLVSMQGGAVEARSEPGKGSVFSLYMPLCPPPDSCEVRPDPEGGNAFAGAAVLLAEDNQAVRDFVTAALESGGYRVLAANGPGEALALASAATAPNARPRLLVTDIIMPDMDGRDLAKRLAEDIPGLSVLFISGYPGQVTRGTEGDIPEGRLLSKPFTVAQLLAAVEAALRGEGKGD